MLKKICIIESMADVRSHGAPPARRIHLHNLHGSFHSFESDMCNTYLTNTSSVLHKCRKQSFTPYNTNCDKHVPNYWPLTHWACACKAQGWREYLWFPCNAVFFLSLLFVGWAMRIQLFQNHVYCISPGLHNKILLHTCLHLAQHDVMYIVFLRRNYNSKNISCIYTPPKRDERGKFEQIIERCASMFTVTHL